MTKPFDGVRILDFTQVLAGPYATFQLGLLGADVIKVERREGEDLRYIDLAKTDETKAWADRGLMPSWQAINGGKRSLTLDLKRPEAVEIVKRLAAKADVVTENFRPGVMDGLGIGYDALSSINPQLVYCAVSAFGQTGPSRLGRGYDGKIQALSGIMSMTGHDDRGPTRVGFAVCDVIAGMTAAFGISCALAQRAKTGKGQLVDVSMLEASIAFMSGPIADYTLTNQPTQLLGNKALTRNVTSDLFPTADGSILLAINSERQFACLMKALGRPDIIDDPRFANGFVRLQNEREIRKIIEDILMTKSAKEWEPIIEDAGAPCTCLWKAEEVIDHPQIRTRGAMQELQTPFGPLRFTGTGFRLAHGNGELRRMAPSLGQDTAEILESLGYSAEEVSNLRKTQVV